MLTDSPGGDREPPVGPALTPEPFPAAAELVLTQHVMRRELAAGAEVVALFYGSLGA